MRFTEFFASSCGGGSNGVQAEAEAFCARHNLHKCPQFAVTTCIGNETPYFDQINITNSVCCVCAFVPFHLPNLSLSFNVWNIIFNFVTHSKSNSSHTTRQWASSLCQHILPGPLRTAPFYHPPKKQKKYIWKFNFDNYAHKQQQQQHTARAGKRDDAPTCDDRFGCMWQKKMWARYAKGTRQTNETMTHTHTAHINDVLEEKEAQRLFNLFFFYYFVRLLLIISYPVAMAIHWFRWYARDANKKTERMKRWCGGDWWILIWCVSERTRPIFSGIWHKTFQSPIYSSDGFFLIS